MHTTYFALFTLAFASPPGVNPLGKSHMHKLAGSFFNRHAVTDTLHYSQYYLTFYILYATLFLAAQSRQGVLAWSSRSFRSFLALTSTTSVSSEAPNTTLAHWRETFRTTSKGASASTATSTSPSCRQKTVDSSESQCTSHRRRCLFPASPHHPDTTPVRSHAATRQACRVVASFFIYFSK
jgi:hypothetical protein